MLTGMNPQKQALRRRITAALTSLPPEERLALARKAAAHLQHSQPWKQARSVLLFLSFGTEISTRPLLEAAFSEGKEVYAPVVRNKDMAFYRLNSADGPFNTGAFGIREPEESAPRWSLAGSPRPALIMVPGLAFGTDGRRLGRGGGFYDRFIHTLKLQALEQNCPLPFLAGYGFSIQLVHDIPEETHDARLSGMATDRGFNSWKSGKFDSSS